MKLVVQRKFHRKAGAAAWRVGAADGAAQMFGKRTGEGQPNAAAAGDTLVGGIPLEQGVHDFWGDALAVVLHREGKLPIFLPGDEGDIGGLAVAEGIGDEIEKDAL